MKKIALIFILCLYEIVCFAQLRPETVGNPTSSTPVSTYTGWANQGVLAFAGNAEVQNTQPSPGSGGGNVFFTNEQNRTFEMSRFPPNVPDAVDIYFAILSSATTNSNELLLEYSIDGINYTRLKYDSLVIGNQWTSRLLYFEPNGINMRNFRLRFTQTSTSKQFRIDDISLSYYYVLPLKLQQFTSAITNNSVQLSWSASSSSNQEAFSVEKSRDGINFTPLGEQAAKGTGTFNYSFTDNSTPTATAYYRLKMRNEDGSFSYSDILRVQPKSATKNILQNIYPLPAKDQVNLQIQSNKTEKAQIIVTDVSGKTLIINSLLLSAGVNTSFISLKSLNKGVYFLKVITSTNTEVSSIMID